MILDEISSALAHLEDITPNELKELSDSQRAVLKVAMGMLDGLINLLLEAKRLNTQD